METVSCNLCGADDAEIIFTGPGWHQLVPEGSALLRCRNCGLVYLNPRPTPEEIGDYYPDDYNCFRPAVEDERFWLMRWMRRHKLAYRRRLVEKFGGRKSGRILDVGCSTGLFLHEMTLAGWETLGVEPTPSAAAYARDRFGLDVFQGILEEAPLTPQSYNVVTFWDVLEHTFSPAETLRRTATLLEPGGLLAINVPNWHSPDRQWFGPHWIGYDPPRHLYVFTRETLSALLRKTGFEPLAWMCFMPSYYPFILSLERWLAAHAPQWAKPVSHVLNFPGVRFIFEPYFTMMNWLQRGSVIAVFARKRME